MEGKDVSKRLALVLIILTVFISATSTWVLISSSKSPDSDSDFHQALVRLRILSPDFEPDLRDESTGNARVVIANKGG